MIFILKTFYFCFSLSIGSLQFLNLYYGEIGLAKGQIGMLFAIGPLVMIVAQPVWGVLTDLWDRPKATLLLTLLGSACTAAFFPFAYDFHHFVILNLFYWFFQSSINPIADSTALALLVDRNDFGKIRLWGSLGYAIGVISIGRILDFIGLEFMFLLHSGVLLITLLVLLRLPIQKGEKKHFLIKEAAGLLKNQAFVLFLFFNFLLQLTINANNSFYGIHMQSLGASITIVGFTLLLKSIWEIPFFAVSGKLMKRFSYPMLLSFAAFIYACRWSVLGFSDNLQVLIWTQILLSFSFSIHYFASVAYVDVLTPQNYRATGQTLYTAVTLGLGGVTGNLLGGWVLNHFAAETMFQLTTILALAGIPFLWMEKKDSSIKVSREKDI